jgi:hypothetical protein
MSKVKISKYIYNKIQSFADKRVEGSRDLYNYRGKSTDSKLREDIMIGTMGEYAVYQVLRESGLNCSKPDLTIYSTSRKSFDPDLLASSDTENWQLHVKSQGVESEKRYGRSCLFQRKDKLITEADANDFIAFTSVNLETREVDVVGFVNVRQITELKLWEECKVEWFRKTKLALYFDNLDKYGIVLEEL